jgi:putative sterol carrier protein
MDCKEIFANIENNFRPETAAGVEAVYQFNISGEGGGEWNVTISGGNCTLREGTADSPNCTVVTDANTWVDIVSKNTSSMGAFMSGKLKIKGDMGLAMKLEPMFLS